MPRNRLFTVLLPALAIVLATGLPALAQSPAATADYPEPFTAAVWRDNVMATQFHPKKSQAVGLKMLRNFAEL